MKPARTGRRLLVALVVALTLLCCGVGTAAAFFLTGLGGGSSTTASTALGCGVTTALNPDSKLPSIATLDVEQIRNSAIIISVGQQMKVPPRGWVIAVATALQESVLHNLGDLGARNDHDSLGLFQQRPSQGWGTPEQLMDPVYASRKFYEKLLKVHDWANMALTDAAQTVQVSAYPDAYAKHEPLATLIVNTLANGAARAAGSVASLRCAQPGEVAASGWTVPVQAAISSRFRPPDRPSHNGVDLAAGRWTPIHAAAAGVVITATCNAIGPDGRPWGCGRDGSTSVAGCGWYVEILHPGNIITRYCHMVQRPDVVVGETVTPGEQIGRVGSTGNSTGPHCHFEVHINGDRNPSGAIDPIPFMNQQGAPLGGAQ